MPNKKPTIIIIIAILIILSIAFTVITKTNIFMTNKSSPRTEMAVDHNRPKELKDETETTEEIDIDNATTGKSEEEYNEKIITNVSLSIETKEFDHFIDNLNKLVNKHKGYVENSNIFYNSRSGNKQFKSAQYTIRMPEEKTNTFISDINTIGNTISQSTSKEDISKIYQDTKGKLKVLETKEKRILKLLEKAEKIEDILKLENELNETIYEKESLIGEIEYMDDKTSYATIYLDISEVEKYTIGETVETKFSEKFKNAFSNSLYYVKLIFENLIIILIYILPFALIGILIYYIINQIM